MVEYPEFNKISTILKCLTYFFHLLRNLKQTNLSVQVQYIVCLIVDEVKQGCKNNAYQRKHSRYVHLP